MRPLKISIAPANASVGGVAVAQTLAGAGDMTLVSSTVTLDYARQIILTSTGNISARTFTVYGTDADGNSISESRAGPNSNSVATTKTFKTVTRIAVNGAVGTNTSADYGGTVLTTYKTVVLDLLNRVPAEISIEVTGTINFTVNETFTNVLNEGTASTVWYSITALASKTANTRSQCSVGATALRIDINTYSDGATLTANIIHSASAQA